MSFPLRRTTSILAVIKCLSLQILEWSHCTDLQSQEKFIIKQLTFTRLNCTVSHHSRARYLYHHFSTSHVYDAHFNCSAASLHKECREWGIHGQYTYTDTKICIYIWVCMYNFVNIQIHVRAWYISSWDQDSISAVDLPVNSIDAACGWNKTVRVLWEHNSQPHTGVQFMGLELT